MIVSLSCITNMHSAHQITCWHTANCSGVHYMHSLALTCVDHLPKPALWDEACMFAVARVQSWRQTAYALRYHFVKLGRQLILYCTPTKPGHSRIFYTMLAERQNLSRLQFTVALLTAKWMKFTTHFVQNDTMDGDNIFLHIQVCHVAFWNNFAWSTTHMPCSLPYVCWRLLVAGATQPSLQPFVYTPCIVTIWRESWYVLSWACVVKSTFPLSFCTECCMVARAKSGDVEVTCIYQNKQSRCPKLCQDLKTSHVQRWDR